MAKAPARPDKQQPAGPQASVSHEMLVQGWQGPLPPPATLEQFDRIVPGSAERIIQMAEAEQRHRHALDQTELSADVASAHRGQWLGGTISLLAIVGAVVSAYIGAHWAVSCALVGVPILGIVRTIVNRRTSG